MSESSASLAEAYLPELRRILTDTVLDFWYPRCLDREHGGYVLGYDREGEFNGNDHKMIVSQARMVWLSARLDREGYGDGEFRDAADLGYEFLRDEMWDDEHGGFYWEVERDGTTTKPDKHLYGQSFGLYALSEYHRSTGCEEARELAVELFELLESEAKDERNGGYVEYFERDWTPIETGQTYLETIEPDWSPKESGDTVLDPTLKLMNTHLHLLEGFTTFHEAIGTDRSAARLHELLHILTSTVVRHDVTACTDKYDPDWSPRLDDEEFRIASYGHDLETVWLTMEACDAVSMPESLFTDLYEELFDYSLEHGYDDQHGGFYFYGPLGEGATNRIKAWWVQAECLTSALKMYRHTGSERYRSAFENTFEFITDHQIDWDDGEWFSGIDEDLQPVGRKGAEYKAAYHNGRALLECIAELESL
ncbi:AGE family epimerase/isomerase (plasmid) [Haladaptatus sp. SPP-AMP-3]|uniref:AGE family epimerase/isomerase n=1 Tax=Haladaptatus sp. SPP-AMP-3 TaxID=3121295 RepID=UPI003C2CBB5C